MDTKDGSVLDTSVYAVYAVYAITEGAHHEHLPPPPRQVEEFLQPSGATSSAAYL